MIRKAIHMEKHDRENLYLQLRNLLDVLREEIMVDK